MADKPQQGFDYTQLAAPAAGGAAGGAAGYFLADPVFGLSKPKHKAMVAALGALAGMAAGAGFNAMSETSPEAVKQAKVDQNGLGMLDWNTSSPGMFMTPAGAVLGGGAVAGALGRPVDYLTAKMARPGSGGKVIAALRILTGGAGKRGVWGRAAFKQLPAVAGTLIGGAAASEIPRHIAIANLPKD